MAWLKGTFDTILRLGDDWALGHVKYSNLWFALHLHDKRRYGWLMTYNDTCEVCGKKFPAKVIGMWHMMQEL